MKMPAVASWMLRIPSIITDLTSLTAPVIDRSMFERLFAVKRRRAIELMQSFGGYRSWQYGAGRSREPDLNHLVHGPDYEREYHRKQKLTDELDTLHAYRAGAGIPIQVSSGVEHRCSVDLPPEILLEPGRLTVTFSTTEELFGRLYELGQAAVNDYDGICKAANP
jgi:hypothetical protein